MKKKIRYIGIAFAIFILTITAIFTFTASAEDGTAYNIEVPPYIAYDANGEIMIEDGEGNLLLRVDITLQEVVDACPEGGRVEFLRAIVLDGTAENAVINVNRSCTIAPVNSELAEQLGLSGDRNVSIIQNGPNTAGFNITSSGATLAFDGCRINAIDVDYTVTVDEVSGETVVEGAGNYPIVTSSEGCDLNLVLRDVTLYLGSLVCTDENVDITVIGGDHYTTYGAKGTATNSALIECLGNADIRTYGSPTTYMPSLFYIQEGCTSAFSFIPVVPDSEVNVHLYQFAAAGDTPDINMISNLHPGTHVYTEQAILATKLAPNMIGDFEDGQYPIILGSETNIANIVDVNNVQSEIDLINTIFSMLWLDMAWYEEYFGMDRETIASIPGVILPGGACVAAEGTLCVYDNFYTETAVLRKLASQDVLGEGILVEYIEFGATLLLYTVDNATVEFYDNDGNLYETVVVPVGSPVNPSYEGFICEYTESNGFYQWCNTGYWVTEDNQRANGIYATTGVTRYYPEKTVQAKMTGLQYNLTVSTYFTINIGVTNVLPENVVISAVNGVPDPEYSILYNSNSEGYRAYPIITIEPYYISRLDNAEITMTVSMRGIVGGSCEVTQYIKGISAYKYMQTVLADSAAAKPQFSHEVHVMMADLMRFCVITVSFASHSDIFSTDTSWANVVAYDDEGQRVVYRVGAYNTAPALYSPSKGYDYRWLLTDLGDEYIGEDGLLSAEPDSPLGIQAAKDDYSNFIGYVNFFTYNYFSAAPRLLIYFAEGDTDDDHFPDKAIYHVEVVVEEGWIPGEFKDEGEGYNWGRTEYIMDDTWEHGVYGTSHHFVYKEVDGVYYFTSFTTVIDDSKGDNGDATDMYENGMIAENDLAYVLPGGIPFYNLDKQWTIYLYYNNMEGYGFSYSEGGVISGTYSLASYYCAMKRDWDGTQDSEAPGPNLDSAMYEISDYVYAIYACSESIANYRFSQAINSNGEIVEY